MPCAAPPASWPRTIAGFTARPTSCATTCRSGVTRPVSSSTATTDTAAPKEKLGCSLSKRPVTSPSATSALEVGVRRPPARGARAPRRATAFPATTVLRLANEPKPLVTSSVSWCRTTTRVDVDAELVRGDLRERRSRSPGRARRRRRARRPSRRRSASTDASSNGPIPPSSTVAATPTPTRAARLRGQRPQAVDVRLVEQPLEEGREVAAAVDDRRRVRAEVVHERHAVGGHEVAAPQLDRVEAELAGDDVEHALADERRLRHPRAAVRADRRPVRQHGVRRDRERLPHVRAGQVRAGQHRRQHPVRPRVRAQVDTTRDPRTRAACRPRAPRPRSRAPARASGSSRRGAPRGPRSTSPAGPSVSARNGTSTSSG